MPTSQARVPTEAASRYLQQLCKHWGHKLPVEFTPEAGHVTFEPGRAVTFEAEADALVLKVEAADEAELRRTEATVVNHLRRFAFREELGEVVWR